MKKYILLSLRMVVAIILLQTLFFKFTAHPDSVYIFSALGLEPYGRIGLGIIELITAILVLIPKTQLLGMVTGFGIILGALASHVFVIGIQIHGDQGGLFSLALAVFLSSGIYLILQAKEIKLFTQSIWA